MIRLMKELIDGHLYSIRRYLFGYGGANLGEEECAYIISQLYQYADEVGRGKVFLEGAEEAILKAHIERIKEGRRE